MIPYGRQSINEGDIEAVISTLKSDFLTTGPIVERFETALQEFIGCPVVVVSSGTAALHCAFAAIGLMPGDEVITTPITFISTQATAAFFGAKIVFADIKAKTGNIDPQLVREAITPKTKAIVAVDFAGHPADLDDLITITQQFNIYLIEDAAHSFGSLYKGRAIGSIADLTTFSFFPTKNITTAEGGAISSKNTFLLEKARRFGRQGLVKDPELFQITSEGPWHQEVQEFGLNYRLPDLLCALGISQLSRSQEFKRKKNEIFKLYNELLEGNKNVQLPFQEKFVDVNWHLYPIHVPTDRRLYVFNGLQEQGIRVQVNYLPSHLQPVFQKLGYKKGNFPISESFYESEISLPIYPDLQLSTVKKIAQTLLNLL